MCLLVTLSATYGSGVPTCRVSCETSQCIPSAFGAAVGLGMVRSLDSRSSAGIVCLKSAEWLLHFLRFIPADSRSSQISFLMLLTLSTLLAPERKSST